MILSYQWNLSLFTIDLIDWGFFWRGERGYGVAVIMIISIKWKEVPGFDEGN